MEGLGLRFPSHDSGLRFMMCVHSCRLLITRFRHTDSRGVLLGAREVFRAVSGPLGPGACGYAHCMAGEAQCDPYLAFDDDELLPEEG